MRSPGVAGRVGVLVLGVAGLWSLDALVRGLRAAGGVGVPAAGGVVLRASGAPVRVLGVARCTG
ncbi:hypothetical protein, partial [Streptomyces sp. NPDC018321]|uniref:hypothetical protein n=1 Tax=Streptomyces sp. NPDC018321 TaxID=3365043 RepID=UPI0037907DC9